MADTKNPQNKKDIFIKERKTSKDRKTPIGVRQDKIGLLSDRPASGQPDRTVDELRSAALGSFSVQAQNQFDDPGPLVPLQMWVSPIEKERTIRLARREGLSISSCARAFYQRGMQNQIDLEYSPHLTPVIEKSLKSGNRRTNEILYPMGHDLQVIKQLLSYLIEFTPEIGKEKLANLLTIAHARAQDAMKQRLAKLTGANAATRPDVHAAIQQQTREEEI
jgi:hypothetical protein